MGGTTPKYLAFSGQTGQLSENHELYSVHVFELLKVPHSYAEVDYYMNGNQYALKREQSLRSGGGTGWSFGRFIWLLFKIALVGGLVFLAYAGVAIYRSKGGHRGKRSDLPLF
jgi:mannose-binding lectin 2